MDAVRFTIEAPLASWAETGAQYRPTDLTPSWAAITGLVGAACGWARGDARLVQLAHDYGLIVHVKRTGQRLIDYHTIQSPHRPALKRKSPRTRAEELKAVDKTGSPHTTLSYREYVQDVRYVVAIAPLSGAQIVPASRIRDALSEPTYPLYAGRRSCLLGRLESELVDGERVEDWLPEATHWDARFQCDLDYSLVRERRDLLMRTVEPRRFSTRRECVR